MRIILQSIVYENGKAVKENEEIYGSKQEFGGFLIIVIVHP